MRVQPPTDPILLEPRAVARPFLQQRLVRDFNLTVAGGQQPGVRQRPQHRFGAIDSLELRKRQAATDERALLAVREP